MRVIAGTARGRRLRAPRGARPTTDRVKEALFSSLQPRLPGATVLDLFAGSGALGVEALSRGAAHAVLVERARAAVAAIRDNLDATGLADRAEIVVGDVDGALKSLGRRFDVVLLDPPYATATAALEVTLGLVAPVVAPDGIVVLESGVRQATPNWPPGLRVVRTRRYGDPTLTFAAPHPPGPP